MKKIGIYLCLIFLAVLSLSSCKEQEEQYNIYFDSAFSVIPYARIYTTPSQYKKIRDDILEEANTLLERLDQKYDPDNEESLLYEVNKNGYKSDVEVDSEFAYILSTALETSKNVSSLYDVSIYPLFSTWGFKTKYYKDGNYFNEPEFQAIEEAKEKVDYTKISIRVNGKDGVNKYYVRFGIQGMAIDLGSIVKGYATDKLVSILKSNGIENGFVNIGGNVYTFGERSFNVGITTPYSEEYDEDCDIVGYVKMENKNATFVTSGVYERYIKTSSGVKYHHILDKTTGYPIQNDLLAVTVIKMQDLDQSEATISTDADALSTALFTMGLEKGLQYANTNDLEAIFISTSNIIYLSNGIKDLFTYNNEVNTIGYAINLEE